MDVNQTREQIEALLTDADAAIINELRHQRDSAERLRLLNELDSLERVRERFYAIFGA